MESLEMDGLDSGFGAAPGQPAENASGSDTANDQSSLTRSLVEARREKNLPGTLALSALLRAKYPRAVQGYQIGVAALREAGRSLEAQGVLDKATLVLGDALWIHTERARLAQHQGHWPMVLEQAQLMRRDFPANSAGWQMGYLALRQLGRVDEARELLTEASSLLAGDEWLMEGAALMAIRANAWEDAARHAQALRTAFPVNEHGHRIGLRCLRLLRRFGEAELILPQARRLFSDKLWLLSEMAALTQARADWLLAVAQWAHVRAFFPNEPDGFIGGFSANLEHGDIKEAAALQEDARCRFGATKWVLQQAAELAERQGKLQQALQDWASLRSAYPLSLESYHGSYRVLRQLGDLGGAEALLRSALTQFPKNRWALREWALIARARFDFEEVDRRWAQAAARLPDDTEIALRHALARAQDQAIDRRDWKTTLERLQALNARLPGYVEGWLEHTRALRSSGARHEAERMARACLERQPEEPMFWVEYALAAPDGTDDTTVDRFAAAAERFPANAAIQNEYARALAQSGRLAEAETLYERALDQFPKSADMACGFAAVAMRLCNWPESLRRWKMVQEKFPRDSRAATGLLDTLAALDSAENPAGALAPAATPSAPSGNTQLADLLLRFASLGGTGQGCEFGLVQRSAGAEPLDLLRWMVITPPNLLKGLRNRFAGLGKAEQTIIDFYKTDDPENPEYRYRDTELQCWTHTFVRKKSVPEADMLKQTCRRMGFLRNKLVADLTEGEKIFVYKVYEGNLDLPDLIELHEAILAYGNSTLLYVRYADNEHPSGSVIRAGSHLLIGYISGFNIDPKSQTIRAPDLPAWYKICETASKMHDDILAERL